MDVFTRLDTSWFGWLNSWIGVNAFFDNLLVFFATYLWYVVVVSMFVLVVATFLPTWRELRHKHIEIFTKAFISAFLARLVFTEFIRYLYDRPRPFEVIEGVRQLIEHPLGGSFPSGHASLSFAVAATVSFYYPKSSILFFLAALVIGVGRVMAGVHWPTDILGGAAVGILVAAVVNPIAKNIANMGKDLS